MAPAMRQRDRGVVVGMFRIIAPAIEGGDPPTRNSNGKLKQLAGSKPVGANHDASQWQDAQGRHSIALTLVCASSAASQRDPNPCSPGLQDSRPTEPLHHRQHLQLPANACFRIAKAYQPGRWPKRSTLVAR